MCDVDVPGSCYYDFVLRVSAVEFVNEGTSGKRDCQYGSYDCSYQRFHFGTPFWSLSIVLALFVLTP
jgi:hypothetical protein